MLVLENIHKNYTEGDHIVRALQGVDLRFRRNEFVSILGPSGCGKTTMLNIIGGLDHYSQGDLRINGVSTRNYQDRDWDTYRNHTIGFVFQSYHLIPHQSVLQNVELALSLSGVSKAERRRRAVEALERVGLADQLRKRPGEMSGGQMQRVAIARALVNNPDVILADEPTGALDTQTSVQVMELLKEIAKDRLVIMVTHNPELAQTYSTRIIRMLDGKIIDDSDPVRPEEMEGEAQQKKPVRVKKPSMSFFTSFGLSLKNLITKKGRTALTAFAGSIGIIGIALIFAVSNGMTTYINMVQEDTLTSYPLTLEATTVDVGTLIQTFMGVAEDAKPDHEMDKVYSQSVMLDMFNALNNIESTENDLKSFREYLEQEMEKPESALAEALSGVQYTYDLDMQVYTENVDGTIIRSDVQKLLEQIISENMNMDMGAMSQSMPFASASGMTPGVNLWSQILSDKNGDPISPVLEKQYDLIYGDWPEKYNEIILVIDENNELEDMTLYALGLIPKEEVDGEFRAVMDGEEAESVRRSWTYEQLCDMTFRVVINSDCYRFDEATGLYMDLRESETGLRYLYDQGLDLKITGIIRPNPDSSSHMLTGSIGYTKGLTDYIVNSGNDSEAVLEQQKQPERDVFTGQTFRDVAKERTVQQKETAFRGYVEELDQEAQAQLYVQILSLPSQEQLDSAVEQTLGDLDRAGMEQLLMQAMGSQTGMDMEQVADYVSKMEQEELEQLCRRMVEEQVKAQTAATVQERCALMTTEQLCGAFALELPEYTPEVCAQYHDELLEFSDSTLEQNLKSLGYVEPDSPKTINLYASTFQSKDVIEEGIAQYNDSVEELKQIRYTDYVGLMMSSITTIINAITYVLIGFVGISLVVSSIMIGVITLISVQERTKEIGILRALGASKANVSGMFNAETVIIGLMSGLMGVGVTYLLCIPINFIVKELTGLGALKAQLPIEVAAILVIISVLLTLICGLIPARSAAKKDPVVALRTE